MFQTLPVYFILDGMFISGIQNYLDPGTGTLIIQMIVGALVGIGITIKLYWYKLKEKFTQKKTQNKL